MYDELVKGLRVCEEGQHCDRCPKWPDKQSGGLNVCQTALLKEAADAIEELQRICDAMKPKHDAVCVKCAFYAEAKINAKGFLICPASGMDITAWDSCSYFEPLPEPPKEET